MFDEHVGRAKPKPMAGEQGEQSCNAAHLYFPQVCVGQASSVRQTTVQDRNHKQELFHTNISINCIYKGVRGQIKTMTLSSIVDIWPCQTATCAVGLKATSCLAPLGRCASKFFHVRSPFPQGWPEDRQVLVLLHLARVAQDRKLDGLARVQAQAELLQRIHGWPHLT